MHALHLHAANMTAPVVPGMSVAAWRGTIMLCYPAILLVAFMVSAATHSIMTAKSEEELYPPQPPVTGPGGKPLPVTRSKRASQPAFQVHIGTWTRRVFEAIAVAVVLTFVADAITISNHVLEDQGGGWWCGEERVVRVSGQLLASI